MISTHGGLRELSLFTGAGGGLLGTALLGWRPVCGVEILPYNREVLLRRQRDGLLPLFPIWDDARTFDGRPWRGRVDVVTGGFPCQPFSSAGRQRGADDERNGWPWTARILREVRPRVALLENVANLLTHDYFGTILGDLAALGYDVVWDCIPASAVGAPHRRDRLWILAYLADARGGRCCESQEGEVQQSGRTETLGPGAPAGDVADADGEDAQAGCERRGAVCRGDSGGGAPDRTPSGGEALADAVCLDEQGVVTGLADAEGRPGPDERSAGPSDNGGDWWATERGLDRVAHGVPHRVDRLVALGNGQVPPVVVRAWRTLSARALAVPASKC